MIQLRLFAALSILLSATSAIGSEKPNLQTGKEAIEKAVDRTNILALHAFEMKAKVHIHELGKDSDGTYGLWWNGPHQWREEINFPGYEEVSIGGKTLVWQKRNSDLTMEAVYYIRSTVGIGGPLSPSLTAGLRSDETIKGVHERKLNGSKTWCWELLGGGKASREMCIGETSGMIVRQDSVTDGDFANVDSKRYPSSFRWKGEGDSGDHMEIKIQNMNTNPTYPPGLFEPLPSVAARPGCVNPESGRLVTTVPPNYPEFERKSRIQGRVALAVLLGTDGAPRGLRLLSAPTLSLAQASADAIKRWRYEPSTCHGVPIEQQVVIVTHYSIQER